MKTEETRPVSLSVNDGFYAFIQKVWCPKVDSWSPVYRDMLEPFSYYKYTSPRLPISLGKIENVFINSPDVLRMIIKWGGSTEIRVPKECAGAAEAIIRLLQYDQSVNPLFKEFFAHITIDNSGVEKYQTQRFPGYHRDGLQGSKFPDKIVCEHSYIFVTSPPTVVALQPFFVAHLNDGRYNVFQEFDKQVKKESLYSLIPEHVYLIDPYVVHTSPVSDYSKPRTFFRLTLTPTELLSPKNTVNPLFSGQNYPARIDVRDFVTTPDIAVPYKQYGVLYNEAKDF